MDRTIPFFQDFMIRDRFYESYLGFVENIVVDSERLDGVLMYRSENVETAMEVNLLHSLVQSVPAASQSHLAGLQSLSGVV